MKLITLLIFLTSFFAWAGNEILVEEKNREELEHHERVGLLPGPVGVVEKVSGAPKVERKTLNFKGASLAISSTLFQGDLFKTDEKSRAHVRFRDKTYLELGNLSAFEAERVRRGAERDYDRKDESIYNFYYGFARVTATSVEDYVRFIIKNGDRIIMLQGPTDLFLETESKNNDLTIHVRRGSVTVIFASKSIKAEISEGQSRRILKDGTIRSLYPLTSRQVANFRQKTYIAM